MILRTCLALVALLSLWAGALAQTLQSEQVPLPLPTTLGGAGGTAGAVYRQRPPAAVPVSFAVQASPVRAGA